MTFNDPALYIAINLVLALAAGYRASTIGNWYSLSRFEYYGHKLDDYSSRLYLFKLLSKEGVKTISLLSTPCG